MESQMESHQQSGSKREKENAENHDKFACVACGEDFFDKYHYIYKWDYTGLRLLKCGHRVCFDCLDRTLTEKSARDDGIKRRNRSSLYGNWPRTVTCSLCKKSYQADGPQDVPFDDALFDEWRSIQRREKKKSRYSSAEDETNGAATCSHQGPLADRQLPRRREAWLRHINDIPAPPPPPPADLLPSRVPTKRLANDGNAASLERELKDSVAERKISELQKHISSLENQLKTAATHAENSCAMRNDRPKCCGCGKSRDADELFVCCDCLAEDSRDVGVGSSSVETVGTLGSKRLCAICILSSEHRLHTTLCCTEIASSEEIQSLEAEKKKILDKLTAYSTELMGADELNGLDYLIRKVLSSMYNSILNGVGEGEEVANKSKLVAKSTLNDARGQLSAFDSRISKLRAGSIHGKLLQLISHVEEQLRQLIDDIH